MTSISVVAGGFTAAAFNLAKLPGTIIAVNDAARCLPRFDIALSMDRLWAENRRDWIAKQPRPVWLRRDAAGRYPWTHLQDNVTLFDCDHASTQLSDEPGRLNGTHSGFCALNLAYQMRPLKIYLLGFDMQRGPKGEQHWYPDYPWSKGSTGPGRLAEWATQFDTAARQLREAGITCFHASSARALPFLRIDRTQLEQAACLE